MTAYSLTATILRFRGEWSLFLAQCMEAEERGETDEHVVPSYRASAEVIENWDRPAESLCEALLALEVAIADYEVGGTPRIPAMMNAAIAWLRAEQKRRVAR